MQRMKGGLSAALISIFLVGNGMSHEAVRDVAFVDVPGYRTLKCDFHMHTVFSDGNVWPSVRVEEAKRAGMDAISVTDHIEYLPHKNDIPFRDRNRPYQIAKESGTRHGILVVNGSEITRSMPPGHANALFLTNANALVQNDVLAVFRTARAQDAFTFWNHPNWINQKADGLASLTDLHRTLLKEGLLQGIEIVNEGTYSEEALKIAYEHNLTLMGCSDVHSPIDWLCDAEKGEQRPLTLVFAKERTEASLKEALVDRRTLVWFDRTLIGRPAWLEPLVRASLDVQWAGYLGKSTVSIVRITNKSGADFLLQNRSPYTLHRRADLVKIGPKEQVELQVKTGTKVEAFDLTFEVLNAVDAPGSHPNYVWTIRTAGAK